MKHKVLIYTEYHSVCPLAGIGTLPPPLSPASVPLPLEPKGWGANSPAGEGLGESQFRRLEKSLALCLLCGVKYTIGETSEQIGVFHKADFFQKHFHEHRHKQFSFLLISIFLLKVFPFLKQKTKFPGLRDTVNTLLTTFYTDKKETPIFPHIQGNSEWSSCKVIYD